MKKKKTMYKYQKNLMKFVIKTEARSKKKEEEKLRLLN